MKLLIMQILSLMLLHGGAGIAQSVYRRVTGCTVGVRFTAGVSDFGLLHNVWTGSGTHSASYPMGTGGLFPWG
jgi:hypothetical protein